MARDQFDLLMSQMLDDALSEAEEADVLAQITQSEEHERTWQDFQMIDRMLAGQDEIAPPVDFTASVMQRIETYETTRRLYPWLAALISLVALAAVVGFSLPWLFLTGTLQAIVADWPIVGTLVIALADVVNAVIFVAQLFTQAMVLWLQALTTDPLSLSVVIAALVLVSTYIGLREVQRTYALVAVEATP